ncbi:hypothetical protein GCM10010508_42020 [Streptomyces naganishii JCM 4654]|uniref:Uncharacterized protein n=1 Tax=Streptomyces naganishii JCM 4654 TaxID=1306179 RepID=A0A919CWX9_9ACTN|nr:hypothetical protein GCM10010508_42020 [Streptomyces naganishii JCM 4654]
MVDIAERCVQTSGEDHQGGGAQRVEAGQGYVAQTEDVMEFRFNV